MTLYELTQEYQELLAMMEDPEIDPQVIADTMEGLDGEIEIKAENYIRVIKELEAESNKLDTEIKRLTSRWDSCQINIRKLKDSLLTSMQETGKDRIQTEHFRISVAKNGGLKPIRVTGDVPPEFCKLEPDNKKIREALNNGELQFAHFEERGVHLSVR